MKLGVAGLIPNWDRIDANAAKRVREHGFSGASVFFHNPLEARTEDVLRLKGIMADAGVEIAQANGWYEVLVNPDDSLRRAGIRGIQALCHIGRLLGAFSVYVRPGSLSPRGAWYPHPENTTSETFSRLVDSLKQACSVAEDEGVSLALEGHVLSPLESAQKMRAVLDAVGSSSLKVNIDPVNFIGTVPDVYNTRPILNDLFDLLGTHIAAAHLKDLTLEDRLVLHIAEVVPGEGTLDYDLFLRRMQALCPEGYCLIEHLPDEKVPQAREAVCRYADRAGIVFD